MTLHSLPDGAELLRRECDARRRGSGITATDLEGAWWLVRLWGRQGTEQGASAHLLRSLGACLRITVIPDRPDGAALELRNSVRLGPLELRFTGPGWLDGRRPLLRFQFERMALLWGKRELGHADLPAPSPQRRPFFALIAGERMGEQGWLAARGRGGGLAAWERQRRDQAP